MNEESSDSEDQVSITSRQDNTEGGFPLENLQSFSWQIGKGMVSYFLLYMPIQ